MVNRFVMDANCWVSLFYRNKYLKVLVLLKSNELEFFSCHENIAEFKDMHRKYAPIRKLLPLPTEKYLAAIDEICNHFEPNKRYALLSDYKDNYLIDLAHQTKSVLVTNDHHFDMAKKLQIPPIKIIAVQKFYELIGL